MLFFQSQKFPPFKSLFSSLARAAAVKKIIWIPEALLKIQEQMPISLFSVFYSANNLNYHAQQTIHM